MIHTHKQTRTVNNTPTLTSVSLTVRRRAVRPGGGVFGVLNSQRLGRNPVVLLGLLLHYLAFYLIFLNIAPDAPQAPEQGTHLQAYITPK